MIFYKSFWWYPEAYNKFKKYGKKTQVQHSQGHVIYIQN